MRCSVVGATGYTGAELVKLLLRHPYVSIHSVTTRQISSRTIRDVVPGLPKFSRLKLERYDFEKVVRGSDIVFLAVPHTTAASLVAKFLRKGKLVIDLSADFRLHRVQDYKRWYGFRHTQPRLLRRAVYGLPEMHRHAIRKTDLIANPGCYATGSILALKPLLAARLIDINDIIVDAKSGVSGAGRRFVEATQFCTVSENFNAYKVNRHQHSPEIEQELSKVARADVKITFVPHLLPIHRGILTTAYARMRKGVGKAQIRAAFRKAYQDEPFVRLREEGAFPALRDVRETNYCDIGIEVDSSKGRVVVISAIDNLVKGAAGQAIQNMNVRCGFPEDAGLTECR